MRRRGRRANANPPRALRLVRIEWRRRNANARSPKQAQPSGALCRLAPYRPCLPACAGYHYSLQAAVSRGPEPPTPNGRVALAVSRTAHPRASHRIWARGASGRESGFALVRPA